MKMIIGLSVMLLATPAIAEDKACMSDMYDGGYERTFAWYKSVSELAIMSPAEVKSCIVGFLAEEVKAEQGAMTSAAERKRGAEQHLKEWMDDRH